MKKIYDNTIKDNSHSDVIKFEPKRWNDKDFDLFLAKSHSKLPTADKNLIL